MPAISVPPPAHPTPIQLDYHVPGRCAVVCVQNVTLYAWRASPEGVDTDAIYRVAQKLIARYPGGGSGLHWAQENAGLPTAEAREGFKRILQDFGGRPGEVGVILPGSGFWASAVRGMIAGLRLAAPSRVGMRVSTSVDELMGWFPAAHAKATGVRVTAAELEAGLAALLDVG